MQARYDEKQAMRLFLANIHIYAWTYIYTKVSRFFFFSTHFFLFTAAFALVAVRQTLSKLLCTCIDYDTVFGLCTLTRARIQINVLSIQGFNLIKINLEYSFLFTPRVVNGCESAVFVLPVVWLFCFFIF